MTRFLPFALVMMLLGIASPRANFVYAGPVFEDATDRYTMVFRGASLPEALEEIVSRTGIDLVYDPQLVSGINVFVSARNKTAFEILREVLLDTDLDYITLSTGTIVIVKASRARSSTGTLSGRIIDGRTGKPLNGASILLVDAGGGTASNQSGFFSLPEILSGPQEIVVSFVGYRPLRRVIEIPVNGEFRTQVSLEEAPHIIEPIIVTEHQRRVPLQNNSSETPGPFSPFGYNPSNDAIQSLRLFSGVQFQLPMADLHIQGSNSNEHRFFLDGVPVYHPYSFGFMFSAFSPFAIDRVSIHKAGFGASAGSQISGLVNLTHDVSNRSSNNLTAHVDPISTNIRGDIGVEIGTMQSETMIAVRNNFWNLYQDPVLSSTIRSWDYIDPIINNLLFDANDFYGTYDGVRHESDIAFSDVHISSRLQIDPFQSLSYSIYAGQNRVETNVLNRIADPDPHYPDFMFARDRYSWQNLATMIRYELLASARTDISTQVSYSSNRMEHDYQMAGSGAIPIPENASSDEAFSTFQQNLHHGSHQSEDNSIQHFTALSEANYAINSRIRLQGGVQFDYVETRINLSDLFYIPTLSTNSAYMAGSYASIDWFAGSNWHLNAGSRLTYVTNTDKFYAEPRISAQYDQNQSSIGYWSFRAAGGIYRQFINQLSVTNVGPSSLVPSVPIWTHAGELTVPKAYHGTASFLLEPREGTTFKIEGFTKWQPVTHIVSYPKLLLSNTDHITQLSDFTETTQSIQAGGGFSLAQRVEFINTEITAGYDFTYSQIDLDSQFGRWIDAPWNEPHRLRATMQTNVRPGLQLFARWSGVYGRNWGYRQAYYDFMMMHERHTYGGFNVTRPEDDTLPAFHQVDVGVHFDQRIGSSTMRLKLDFINVLNRRNVLDNSIVPVHSGENPQFVTQSRRLPGFNPTASLQISF
ncbi:MAG: TonB-dependent receptor [Balneolales bacterium]|nr:TonB-dependent receptor [Balneolales bacterium]